MASRSPLRFIRNLAGACLLAVAAAPVVAGADASGLVAKVEAKYATVESIKADFVQTTKSEVFGEEVKKGVLEVKRPSKMRWKYGDEQLLVTDGNTMWIYDKAAKQVLQYDDVAGSPNVGSPLLSLDKLTELHKVEVLSLDEKEGIRLQLTPREEGPVKQMQLTFDVELKLTKVQMTDTHGLVTDVELSEVQLNPPMEDKLFTFEAPADVEVIGVTP